MEAIDNPTITSEIAVAPVNAQYRISAEYLEVTPTATPQLIDITSKVAEVVKHSGIVHGQAVIFCRHTTASVVMNEDEPLLHEDIAEFLEGIASSTSSYKHDDFAIRTENLIEDHGLNAHAHLKHLLLGATLTVPVVDCNLVMGAWQRVFLLEMDRPRPRALLVQVSGADLA